MKVPSCRFIVRVVSEITNSNWGRRYQKNSDANSLSRLTELHVIDRANPVHFLLVTESATDKYTEFQVKPNPNACNVTQTQDIYVKKKQTPIKALGIVW